MKKTKKELEQCWKRLCAEAEPGCDIYVDKNMPLPMIMVQGWFYDQSDCFELLRQELTDEEQTRLFYDEDLLESVKVTYKKLWNKGDFSRNICKDRGVHKWLLHLNPKYFGYWIERVSEEIDSYGDLEKMLEKLGTVEAAHDRFKQFYKTQQVRILNAADAARLLARYGCLKPERTPLLASGALRGAAILLKGKSPQNSTDALERKYSREYKRMELENEAASYIDATEALAHFGKWKMEKGESIFCELQKQPGVSHQSRRRKR